MALAQVHNLQESTEANKLQLTWYDEMTDSCLSVSLPETLEVTCMMIVDGILVVYLLRKSLNAQNVSRFKPSLLTDHIKRSIFFLPASEESGVTSLAFANNTDDTKTNTEDLQVQGGFPLWLGPRSSELDLQLAPETQGTGAHQKPLGL